MAVAYERYEGEIEATESLSIESEEAAEAQALEQATHKLRILQNGWPLKIGSVILFLGSVATLIGLAEVVIVPLVEASSLTTKPKLDKTNLWGLGMWAGILLIATGNIALKSGLARNVKLVYAFISLIMLDVVLFTGVMILCMWGYTSGSTIPPAYVVKPGQPPSALFGVHLALVLVLVASYITLIIAFVQYYEDVLFGEPQLCRRCIHCCLPCWCPRAVDQEELLQDGTERPPSLPV